MKKVISIAAILVLSLGLFGCQYFQPPAETTTDKEAAVDKMMEEEVAPVEQEMGLTILEGDDDDDDSEQEASVEIEEESMEKMSADEGEDQEAAVMIEEE